MPYYRVFMTAKVRAYAEVDVYADDEDGAVEQALDKAERVGAWETDIFRGMTDEDILDVEEIGG